MSTSLINSIKVEPYWNVNDKMLEKIDSTNKIKVEPYWNVNLKNELTALNKSLIKVEPYWNVNFFYSSKVSIPFI